MKNELEMTFGVEYLIKTLEQNRNKHRLEFEKALEGYQKECIKILEHNLQQIKEGKKITLSIYEQIPEDHTKDYDVVIRMLDLTVDKQITLSTSQFREYVMDEWGWKSNWSTSNSKYLNNN